jgi:SpoVK/Ycf46/Vps4 family AAA+-type ATPase
MNQVLLKRLFRSLPLEEDSGLERLAQEIIQDERKKGHNALAESLVSILKKRSKPEVKKPSGNVVPLHDIPLDRRYKIPLVSYVDHGSLRHDMVLPDTVEQKIRRIEEEFAGRERLAHHGLSPRRRILFHGSPGCGKSMAAERIAWNLGLPFLKVKFDTLVSSFLGESANNIKTIFESVHEYPCVLLLDEFDFIGKSRTGKNDVGEMHRLVNILLQLMEDYKAPGILVATTNLQDSLDEALFRRFDDVIEMPRPEEREILEILKMTLSSIATDKKIPWNALSRDLVGVSSAIVVKIAHDSAKEAVLKGDLPLTEKHIRSTISEVLARRS